MLPWGIAWYNRLQNKKEQEEVATSGIVQNLYTASLHTYIAPEYAIRAVSNLLENLQRYSQLKVHHCTDINNTGGK